MLSRVQHGFAGEVSDGWGGVGGSVAERRSRQGGRERAAGRGFGRVLIAGGGEGQLWRALQVLVVGRSGAPGSLLLFRQSLAKVLPVEPVREGTGRPPHYPFP